MDHYQAQATPPPTNIDVRRMYPSSEKKQMNKWMVGGIIGILVIGIGGLIFGLSRASSHKSSMYSSGSDDDVELTSSSGNKIIVATDNLLDQYIQSNKPFIVAFTQKRCGPCENLLKYTWPQLAKRSEYPVLDAELNNTPNYSSKFNIQGTPTILFIQGNNKREYSNARDSDQIYNTFKQDFLGNM